MKLKNIKNVIFDLDGTLAESAKDIILSFKKAYRLAGLRLIKEPDKYIVGPPIAEIVKKFSPGIGFKVLKRVVSNFRSCYDNSDYRHTELMPGVKKLLAVLKKNKIKMFVVTNKPLSPSQKILKKLGITNYFSLIIGPNIISKKKLKKFEMVKYALKKAKLSKTRTLVVGDAPSDVIAAKKNKLPSAIILGGYAKHRQITFAKPGIIVSKPEKLIKLILNQ